MSTLHYNHIHKVIPPVTKKNGEAVVDDDLKWISLATCIYIYTLYYVCMCCLHVLLLESFQHVNQG